MQCRAAVHLCRHYHTAFRPHSLRFACVSHLDFLRYWSISNGIRWKIRFFAIYSTRDVVCVSFNGHKKCDTISPYSVAPANNIKKSFTIHNSHLCVRVRLCMYVCIILNNIVPYTFFSSIPFHFYVERFKSKICIGFVISAWIVVAIVHSLSSCCFAGRQNKEKWRWLNVSVLFDWYQKLNPANYNQYWSNFLSICSRHWRQGLLPPFPSPACPVPRENWTSMLMELIYLLPVLFRNSCAVSLSTPNQIDSEPALNINWHQPMTTISMVHMITISVKESKLYPFFIYPKQSVKNYLIHWRVSCIAFSRFWNVFTSRVVMGQCDIFIIVSFNAENNTTFIIRLRAKSVRDRKCTAQ